VKRHVREAYRQHKEIHYQYLETEGKQLAMMLIYLGEKDPDHEAVTAKIILTLQRLVKKCKSAQSRDEKPV